MENVYSPDSFDCSDNIDMEKHFTKNVGSLKLGHDTELDDRSIHNMLVSKMRLNPLQERQTLGVLRTVDDLAEPNEVLPSATGATCKAKSLKIIEKLNDLHKDKVPGRGLNAATNDNMVEVNSEECNKASNVIKCGDEFAVSIRVYEPFTSRSASRREGLSIKMKFSHEIVLLGSNTLVEFRDKILCSKDSGLCVEADYYTAEVASAKPKDVYPSGFIFVNGTFYNDRRHPESIDYSEVIRQWSDKQQELGPFKTASMHETKIKDLKPRFGYAYVYQHQANCEHIICFSDMWFLSSRDNLDRACYPMYSEREISYSRPCTICQVVSATWMCTESDRLPHHNTFMCDTCYKHYNFKDGSKVGSFQAYPFHDRNLITN